MAFLKESLESRRVIELTHNTVVVCGSKSTNNGLRRSTRLRNMLKGSRAGQLLLFMKKSLSSYLDTAACVKNFNSECILIRLDGNCAVIPLLRIRYPKLIVAAEVNASGLDEQFSRILFKRLIQYFETWCLQRAHANFFVTNFLRQELMSEIKNDRDFVVHNGVDTARYSGFQPRRGELGPMIFTYVGTLDINKRVEVLIEAFARFVKLSGRSAYLRIFGSGPAEEFLRAMPAAAGIDGLVEFEGWIEHERLPEILASVDVAIHHFAMDYMCPLKILEYMAAGLPVIGPRTHGVQEMFVDGEDIVLTDSSVEAVCSKMQCMAEDVMLRERVARNGQIKVTREYTWRANAETILRVLQEKRALNDQHTS
ncbi:MAG: hypothetical protein CMN28_13440 [Salinisphaeraceae bacterium]|nr:hypothetical protein [Salinisphaeraceae bacterium]